MSRWRILAIGAFALALTLPGCASPATSQPLRPCAASQPSTWTGSAALLAPESVTLTGTVLLKPPSDSYESYNAGGKQYYVLDTDVAAAIRTAAEGVILRPSRSVSASDLAGFAGKRVEVHGVFLAAASRTSDTGSPSPSRERGSGFRVDGIRLRGPGR